MDNNDLKAQIQKLGFLPTEELVTAVQEAHLKTVPDATIRRAFSQMDKKRREQEKLAKQANKQAPAATGTSAPSVPEPAAAT